MNIAQKGLWGSADATISRMSNQAFVLSTCFPRNDDTCAETSAEVFRNLKRPLSIWYIRYTHNEPASVVGLATSEII